MADDNLVQGRGTTSGTTGSDWTSHDAYWRDNFSMRPYAQADRGYEYYEPGYRFGYESANRYRGRRFEDAEPDLRRDWDSYEHRGSNKSTWDEIKDSVRDAWNRVTGSDESSRHEHRGTRTDRDTRI